VLESAALDNDTQLELFENCTKLFEDKKGTLSDEEMCTLLRDNLNKVAPSLAKGPQGPNSILTAGMKEEITLEFVLSSVLGNFYYNGWVFSPQGPGPVGGQLFGLIMEIQVFKKLESVDGRLKRCKTILRRFNAEQLGVPPLKTIQDEFKESPEKFETRELLDADLFDQVLAVATTLIGTQHFMNFKKSPAYNELLKEMEENYKKKGNKQTGHLQLKGSNLQVEGGEGFYLKKQLSSSKSKGGLLGAKYKPGPGSAGGAIPKRLGGGPQGQAGRLGAGGGLKVGGKLANKSPLLTFQDCLGDKLGGHIFMSFCRQVGSLQCSVILYLLAYIYILPGSQEGVEQNMLFCGGHKFFKMANSKPDALKTISDRVQVIVDKYIVAGSNLDLELDEQDRAGTGQALLNDSTRAELCLAACLLACLRAC
jgi:hypothetical protein